MPLRGSRRHFPFRWLAAAFVAAATPKCLLCVFGYLGLAGSVGWFGPELCGAATPPLVSAIAVVAGLSSGAALALIWHRGRK